MLIGLTRQYIDESPQIVILGRRRSHRAYGILALTKLTYLIGNHEVKVAAYCRVSTDIEKQLHSLENQVQHYTIIRSKPNWKFIGVYFDNGTSEYCHQPRTVKEVLAFMLERKQMGKTTLVDRVVMSLFEEGTFDRFLRKRENFREYMYHVKKYRN